MTFNSQDIIQKARAKFEMMLNFVTGPEAQTATVDHIERCLFRRLLSLGAQLLLLFSVVRSQNCSREPIQKGEKQELPYYADRIWTTRLAWPRAGPLPPV